MASNDGADAFFNHVATQMANLNYAIGTQSVADIVPTFSGTPSAFREWILGIEKFARLSNITGNRIRLVAYQSSRGPVSDFIHRYLGAHEDGTWDHLKTELTNRFAEVVDPSHAFCLLRQCKQKPQENVQIYAERLLTLAEQAYAGLPQGDGAQASIERQLVTYFTDGLAFDYLKMKVLRDNPATLQAAVTIAAGEQNLRKRFDLRLKGSSNSDNRREEPMEVGHYRPQKKCFNCKRAGHVAKECRVRKVNEVNCDLNVRHRHLICWSCGKRGHIKRDCPLWQGQGQEQEN